MKQPEFRNELAENYVKRKKIQDEELKMLTAGNKANSYSFVFFEGAQFCFVQLVKDLPYIPVVILTAIIGPWRLFKVVKKAYRYETPTHASAEIQAARQLSPKALVLTIKDWRAVVELVILIALPIRIAFLVTILSKNVFRSNKPSLVRKASDLPHPSLTKKTSSIKKRTQTQGTLLLTKRLDFHKCVHVTFIEFAKDLLVLPFGVAAIAIAPWRVITVFDILRSQVDRVPAIDKPTKITSRRLEVVNLLGQVLVKDVPCLLITLLLVVFVWRLPRTVQLYCRFLKREGQKAGEVTNLLITAINYHF